MEAPIISKTLMRRLPLYLEYLRSLPGEVHNVSATTIAAALGLGEVQVRKDLAKIAGEGRCRTGRSRDRLIRNIEQAMGDEAPSASILVGSQLLEKGDLTAADVNVLACFEMKPTKKRTPCGCPIYSIKRLENFCKCYNVNTGIIAVPGEEAQAVCDGLIACGVQVIRNMTAAALSVPQGVQLQSEDPIAV